MADRHATWTIEDVAARFEEAASTGRRLPPVRVQGYFNCWPAIVRKEWETFAADEKVYRPFPPALTPSTGCWRRCAGCSGWRVEQRHLVWMRAKRYGWRDITIRFACDRTTAWRRWQRALQTVADQLNGASSRRCFGVIWRACSGRDVRGCACISGFCPCNKTAGSCVVFIYRLDSGDGRGSGPGNQRVLPGQKPMRGARARRFFSVRARTKVTAQVTAVTTPAVTTSPDSSFKPATAFVGGFSIFRISTLNTLNVEYRKVEALIPYARNPRTHADAQIAKIAASIVEYGWTNPILVDGDNGIIAGHGRLAAARKLGWIRCR
jgi:hypothetical protein